MTDNKVQMNSETGKQTIDDLMAKMTPEQQAQFKAALDSDTPVHVHVGKDGSIVLGDEADAAAPPPAPGGPVVKKDKKPESPRLKKIEEKRQKILQDRLRRHMGRGLTQEQAFAAMQREDYENMPTDKRLARLESMVSQSFQRLANDVMNLSQGHMSIADAFDINYRAIQKVFLKLGVTDEEQKAFIAEAQQAVIADRQKFQEEQVKARAERAQAQQAASEVAAVKAELTAAETPSLAAEVSEGAEPPAEATVFGG